jgi:hypothetical protein
MTSVGRGQHKPQRVVSNYATNPEKRMARVRVLAEELHLKAALNTDKSRARCIRIAQEIAGLLQAEDAHRRRLYVTSL